MTDIALTPVGSGYNLSVINANFDAIQTAINTELLHLTGGNNTMVQSLDMNSNRMLNLPLPVGPTEPLLNSQLAELAAGDIGNATNIIYGAADANIYQLNAFLDSVTTSLDTIEARVDRLEDRYDDYAAMRASDSFTRNDGDIVAVTGAGVRGLFIYTVGTVPDDGAIRIVPNDSNNVYYQRIYDAFINVQWFGAKGDSVTDDLAAINAGITYVRSISSGVEPIGGTLFFPNGRYMVSDSVSLEDALKIVLQGEGFGSQIYPMTSGYNTVKVVTPAANPLGIEIRSMNVYVRDNHIGIQWEVHQGGIFNCFINSVSNPANACTGIQLDQTAGNTGSWITDIMHTRMDLGQPATATNITGIDIIGAANRINIGFNTLAGFNGTGVRISQFATGADTQMVNIFGNDIESMTRLASVNIAFDIQGIATGIYIHHNYLEGIEGDVASRFLRVGAVSVVRALQFSHNYCLTENPLPGTFKGIELIQAISPDISHNFYAPAGGGDIVIKDPLVPVITGITNDNPGVVTAAGHGLLTGNSVVATEIVGMTELNGRTFVVTVIDGNSFSLDGEDTTLHTPYVSDGVVTFTPFVQMGIPNQIDSPIKYVYNLMDTEQTANQVAAVVDTYEDVTTSKTYVTTNNNLSVLATFEVAYIPGVGAGERYFFSANTDSGGLIPGAEVTSLPSGTTVHKASKVFTASINDLTKIQGQVDDVSGIQGWQVLDAKIIVHSN
jgi:hypothetical protein